MTRRAVTFSNGAGETLFGILHEPVGARTDVGVVLLSPGVKSRVAPHRLYVKMARRLEARGFKVLRFDFAGLGDSAGQVREAHLADLYRSIQLGRYTDDTRAAIDWMRTSAGVSRVVLGGLCGGAIAGLLAAETSDHVAGLFGLGIPVVLDGTAVDKVTTMSEGQRRSVRQKYLKKLLDPASWWRIVTLKTDFRLLARVLGRRRTASAAPKTQAVVLGDNGNPRFAPALFDMLRRDRPVLLVFSGADRLQWEYQEKFADPNAALLAGHADRLDVEVIERANHVLTFEPWQDAFFARCDQWFARYFPDRRPAVE